MKVIAKEEVRSTGPLVAFIDLLFLLVAFFILLLFFMQNSRQMSEERLKTVQESLQRITGEKIEVDKALEKLEPLLERFMVQQEEVVQQQKAQEAKEMRRRARTTTRLNYVITEDGQVDFNGKRYSLQEFLKTVVAPLRDKHWIAFRAQAGPGTPFGKVVAIRAQLLEESQEFDTYWDNLTQGGAEK